MPIPSHYLAEIVQQFESAGVFWGIFAGAAAHAYGVKRRIRDIDILIPSGAGAQVAAHFSDAAIEYDPAGRVALLALPEVEIIAGLTRNIVLEMDAEMIARLQHRKLLGVQVNLIPLEDNLVFKAVLGRGIEVGKHDWADIAEIVASTEIIDWDYLAWRLARCAPDRILDIMPRLQKLAHK